ncbi:hypothetical protein J6590_078376, partial [Homalodisca vitripennis]
ILAQTFQTYPTALSLLHLKPLYEYMAVCTSISGIHVCSSIVLSVRAFQLLLHTFCSRLPHNSYPHSTIASTSETTVRSAPSNYFYTRSVLAYHTTPTPTALSLLHLKPLYEYMAVCTSISGIHVYSSIVLSVRALLHTFCSRLPHNSYPTALSLLHLKPLYEYMAVCTSISGIHVYSSIVLSVRAFQLLLHTFCSRLPHNSYPTALSLLHLKPLYEYMAVCTSISGIHVYSSIVLSVRALLHTFCSRLPHNSYPHSTIASTSETTVRVYGRLYIYFWNTCLLINSPVSPCTSTHVLFLLTTQLLPPQHYRFYI